MDTFSRRRRLFGPAAWLWVVLAAGLQGQSSGSRRRLANLGCAGQPATGHRRADAMIAAMHDALMWELNSGLQQGGATWPSSPATSIRTVSPSGSAAKRVARRGERATGCAIPPSRRRLGCPARQRQCRPPRQCRRRVPRRSRRESGRPQAHRRGAEMCRLPWTGRQVHHRRPRGARGPVSGRPRRRLQRRRHPGVVLGRDTEGPLIASADEPLCPQRAPSQREGISQCGRRHRFASSSRPRS